MADNKSLFHTRIQHKIDTAENWSKATNFIPLKGEIIVYTNVSLPISEDEEIFVTLFKVGDGQKPVAELDFVYEDTMTQLSTEALRLAMKHTDDKISVEAAARLAEDEELRGKITVLREDFENAVFITVADIDAICGATIVLANEVTF